MAEDTRQRASRLYWIPFLAGLGSACFYVYIMADRGATIDLAMWFTMVIGTVIGLLAVAMSVLAAASSRRVHELRGNQRVLEENLVEARARNEQLNSRIQVFAAMREVVRVLADTVDFEPIATEVMDILAPLLGSEEIALIVRDEDGELAVKALRRSGKTICGDGLADSGVEFDTAEQALQRGALVKAVDGSKRVFCLPLFADGAAVGALRFEIRAEGLDDNNERRVDALEATLVDIGRHLALAVKTPRLHDRAIIDSLTGLFTRRHFDNQLDALFRLARRYAAPFSLVLLDIDGFKQINDSHGHPAGDSVLRGIAGVITGSIRECDSAFRYGGDEMALLLPETTSTHAALLADRLRTTLNAFPFKAGGKIIRVGASQGVAQYSTKLKDAGQLFVLADEALYKAKRAGRDLVVLADDPLGNA